MIKSKTAFNLLAILLLLKNVVYAQPRIVDTIVNIGKVRLHFKIVKGRGMPILFETGGGNDIAQLDTLLLPLFKATSATLVVYDRQGFGKSSLDTANYNIRNEIKSLESGLAQLGYGNTRMILVCHSLGAFYSRLYASRHPKLVKGMVMLDPRIASYADMAVAKKTFDNLDQVKLKMESLSLYLVLKTMEQNSNTVRQAHLSANLPVFDVMAEHGPYDLDSANEAFKERERQFMKPFRHGSVYYAKGSQHNIPQNQPDLAVRLIAGFYKKYCKR